MTDYESNMTIAQSCGSFKSTGTLDSRFGAESEGISCSACKNWNGVKCLRNAYGHVASQLGIDE